MWFRDTFSRSRNKQGANGSAPGNGNGQGYEILFPPGVIHQLDHLMLSASRSLPGYSSGLRASARRRPQLEFREHRMYTPGDDIRFVDWKASARQEHIFIKQGEHHKEASVYVMLDCSASMGWGDPPKSGTARRLAALLGYLSLAHGDRFFCLPFQKGPIQPLGPVTGKGQVTQLFNLLRGLTFEGQADFAGLGQQALRRYGNYPGKVLVISDFIDLDAPRAFLDLFPAPRWEVVLLHVLHPQEVNPSYTGDYEFEDIETGQTANLDIDAEAVALYRRRLEEWRKKLDQACVDSHAYYLPLESAQSDYLELIARLREMHLLRAL